VDLGPQLVAMKAWDALDFRTLSIVRAKGNWP